MNKFKYTITFIFKLKSNSSVITFNSVDKFNDELEARDAAMKALDSFYELLNKFDPKRPFMTFKYNDNKDGYLINITDLSYITYCINRETINNEL